MASSSSSVRLLSGLVLDLVLARHQQRTDFHVRCGLRLAHLFNRGRPVLFEVGCQCQEEIPVERSTRGLQ